MTEVEKVSIGGYAFTLEVGAYAIVKQYLDELSAHYSGLEGGAEVMEGIEERMAELLYEKCADDGVASVEEVREIIDVLGKPSAIESDDDPQPKRPESDVTDERPKGKRRLYRDPTNKMLGGVCSGLAAYLKCDVVLIRIIFIGLALLTCVVKCHVENNHLENFTLNLWAPVVYIILWIAMPEARTVQQRWQMGVSNPPAGAVPVRSSEPTGSGLGRVLRIIIGICLMLTAVCGLTFLLAALSGFSPFSIFDSPLDILAADKTFPLISSTFYRVLFLLFCFLPGIGMLYGGIMLLFDLKSPSWRPGLVIFMVWVIVLTVLTVLTLMGLFPLGIFD